ncbi:MULTISPECIES: TonB-dependent siderophore receptor [unclassified Janthinobacterium]|uniref:TonB-dependent siderophore receptor n=1 Tax=unclassified Janthinobacterium TaxID=2610881 RepID=UPI00161BDBDB|nr:MULTISPECIES: TonB-dependent siderophore receptor [unclassified Janthinobacterium]MBB5607461.1 iron complex outermembrane receptor protein [Janthinobacterium sp. S3T4]MBB5612482.1 iron complex outermembrane receptor protein [Janthinobacterium sp. S3M3]
MFPTPSSAKHFRVTRLHLALVAAGLCALHTAAFSAPDAADAASSPGLDAGPVSQVVVKATVEKKKLSDSVSSGALGRKSELDTPFSTKAVSSDEIEDRLATSISEVLKYDASVTAISPPISTHPATIQIRGLRLDDLNGYKVDGLANINRGTEMPLEMFESVEVLKGLSGYMYGFGSPGGIVNYVSKRPTTDKSFSAALGYQEGGAIKEHIDTGGRLGEDGAFGYRLNLLHEDGGVKEESGSINRNAASLNLDWRLSRDLTLSYDVLYQRRATVGGTDIVIAPSFKIPAPIAGDSKLNSIGAGSDVEYSLYTTGLEYRLAPDWTANFSYRTSDSSRVYKKDQYYITSNTGNYKDRVTSERHDYHFDQVQASLTGKFATFGLQHEVVAGVMSQNLGSTDSVVTPKPYLGTGNLYAPTIFNATSTNYSGGLYQDETTRQDAVFASDTVKLSDHWSVLAGLRYTQFQDTAYSTKGAVIASYPANKTTPTIALMYKPGADTTLYGSYVEALEQASSAPTSAVNALQTFAPIKSKQTEFGIKTERSFWNASAALFQIERGAQYTNAANIYVADGQTRYQGLEFNSVLQAAKNVSIEGGIMLLDATLQDAAPGYSGKRAVGAPRQQASVQATWREVLPGLALHAGAQYLGKLAMDAANANTLPDYTLFDAGFNYRHRYFGKMVSVRANISNLTNRKYWTFYQENYLNVGSPRTASVNVRVDF